MHGSAKSPEDWIRFLLSVIDHHDGKIDFEGVAKDTGLYKSGKFVRQALGTLKKNYGDPSDGEDKPATHDDTPKTPTSIKKRGSADCAGDSRKPLMKRAKKTEERSDDYEGVSGEVDEKVKANSKNCRIDVQESED